VEDAAPEQNNAAQAETRAAVTRDGLGHAGEQGRHGGEGKGERLRKKFFLEKKNQKTFPGCFARTGTGLPQAPTGKSSLLLFFKKEVLPSRFS
jgi:hypothetical protein